jgi:Pyruvate/2-oxoacid:ferredoxin oxidoreductase gamma subunit
MAGILGDAALALGAHVVVGQAHGMAQRGGSVRAPVVIGPASTAFFSAGEADVLLALDPLEAARAAPWLVPGGLAVVSTVGVPVRGAPSTDALLGLVQGRVHRVDPPSARLAGPAVLGAFAALFPFFPVSLLVDALGPHPAARDAFAAACSGATA